MKPGLKQPYANYRVFLLRLLGRLHCALIVAICCSALFAMLRQKDVAEEVTSYFPTLAAISPMEAYLRGLLFALPVALSFYAIRLCPKLWQFLLCAVGLSGLSWLLLGHPMGALLTAFCCFFRARRRLAEELDESALDVPSYVGLAVFAVTFCISAVMGHELLQKLSVLSAALYFLVCLCYGSLCRLDEYLRLNEKMDALPSRRIQRIAGSALIVSLALAAALLLPAVLGVSGDFQIDLTHRPLPASPASQLEMQNSTDNFAPGPALEEIFGDSAQPLFHIPEIVSYLFYAVIVAGLALLVLFFVYRLFLSFRRSFTDSKDQVQYLGGRHEDEDQKSAAGRIERPRMLDRSPNAVIRRRYRKQVLRAAKEPPRPAMTPQEIEAQAGLTEPVLHELYERARYGEVPCTAQEVQRLKRKT